METKETLINQAVTKGLDPNVEMKPSGVEWIGEIPAHWNLAMLKYAARSKSSNPEVNIDIKRQLYQAYFERSPSHKP